MKPETSTNTADIPRVGSTGGSALTLLRGSISEIEEDLARIDAEHNRVRRELKNQTDAAAYYARRVETLEAAISDALMHLDTNYCIDGHSMKDSDAATALRRVFPNTP